MTRRRAAWIGGVVAILLAATYLLTRRGSRTPEPAAVVLAPPAPPAPAGAVTAAVPMSPPPPPLSAGSTPTATTPVVDAEPEPRSWGTARAVPARTPPTAPGEPAAQEAPMFEQPLATWLRVSIIAVALLAFFAVSLIATKQV